MAVKTDAAEREKLLEQMTAFTDEIIGGWIYGDIAQGLGMARKKTVVTWDGESRFFGGQNLLLALGLTCYTEFIGSLINGTFGKQGHSAKDFDTFLFCYMNRDGNYKRAERQARKLPQYNAAKNSSAIYQLVRCGLAHNYVGKGRVQFFAEHLSGEKCGIKIVTQDRKKVVQFLAGRYLADLVDGVKRYRGQASRPRAGERLRQNFMTARRTIDGFWK